MKKYCLSCLATLLKISCPWYLYQQVYKLGSLFLGTTLFWFGIFVIAFLPEFGERPLHNASLPAKLFWPEILAEFEQNFPVPDALQHHVRFWKDVYTRYTSKQVILHDKWYPQIIYEVVSLETSPGVNTLRRKYKRTLLALHRKDKNNTLDALTPEESRIYKMFASIDEPDKFFKAAKQRLRIQCGQRDRFVQALQRSGLYQKKFEQIFKEEGLPLELTCIPFVESYFTHSARSYAGAAGLWQFMPATARMYGLQITRGIDERYDPFKSARSAARLLKANYDIFHSWPLAITAYNHGTRGILTAKKRLKTSNLGEIVRTYHGARFGFYSQNYYAQFLATAQAMQQYEKYFGPVKQLDAIQYESVRLPRPLYLSHLLKKLSLSSEDLLVLNRDFKRLVIQSKTPIPKNFSLKLPPGKKQDFLAQFVE